MREFGESTSSYYSSRTGTIYPLVDRLCKGGLLEWTGAGKERRIRITAQGNRRLTNWLKDPIPVADIAHTADLVRLRAFYLATISPVEREQFVQSALAQLQEHLQVCRRSAQRDSELGDPFSALASEGAIYETEARIRWLEATRDRLIALPGIKPKRRK